MTLHRRVTSLPHLTRLTAMLFFLFASGIHSQSAARAAATPQQNKQPQPPKVARGYDEQDEYTDPAGTYAGFTICADCSGMSVRLELTDAAGAEDHGTFKETMLYLDAPTHAKHGATSKDQRLVEIGTWKLAPATSGGMDRQLCLTTIATKGMNGGSPDCYHLVHQTVLVDINGFETDHQPDPFPVGLKTLLKQRRLSDGHEYPMLPVDDWVGFAVLPAAK